MPTLTTFLRFTLAITTFRLYSCNYFQQPEKLMRASPLIPGRAYHVRGMGLDLTVFATDACDAICIGIELLIEQGGE